MTLDELAEKAEKIAEMPPVRYPLRDGVSQREIPLIDAIALVGGTLAAKYPFFAQLMDEAVNTLAENQKLAKEIAEGITTRKEVAEEMRRKHEPGYPKA